MDVTLSCSSTPCATSLGDITAMTNKNHQGSRCPELSQKALHATLLKLMDHRVHSAWRHSNTAQWIPWNIKECETENSQLDTKSTRNTQHQYMMLCFQALVEACHAVSLQVSLPTESWHPTTMPAAPCMVTVIKLRLLSMRSLLARAEAET